MSISVMTPGGRWRKQNPSVQMAGLAAILLLAAVVGVALVVRFVDAERDREIRAWQAKLGIVADSRLRDVETWNEQQFAVLTGLAENASLQLYLTELAVAADRGSAAEAERSEVGYLRNLLVVTADGSGFAGRFSGPDVNANVNRVGLSGLALLNRDGRVIAATPTMPPIEGELYRFVADAPPGQRRLLDLHLGVAGTPTMAFLAPIFAVQGDRQVSDQVGTVVGVREVGDDLFSLLEQPGTVQQSLETILVRRNGAAIEYLSPLLDGKPPLRRTMAADTPELAAGFAVTSPGGFAMARDYRDREVLVTARKLMTAPWTLFTKVDGEEALADSDNRLDRLLWILLLSIALVTAGMIAVWRHGTSRRASEAAARYREAMHLLEQQRDFLTLLTDSQPNAIYILDDQSRFSFANAAAADQFECAADDMKGKTLTSVMGPAAAKVYQPLNEATLRDNTPRSAVHTLTGEETADGRDRIIQTLHVPLPRSDDIERAVLVIEENITEAITERVRRERTLKSLVRTLLTVIDKRDPHAADHSSRVARVAHAIAEEMGEDDVMAETASIAGSLLNVGKILVPTDVLTKNETLSAEELTRIRDGINASADLLEGLEFDGPVVDTLRQAQERWDGTGPGGRTGADILITSRIVAAANAFVALVSPRAHRDRHDFDAAIEIMLGQVGASLDRSVVAALVNHLDNRGGREEWAEFLDAA